MYPRHLTLPDVPIDTRRRSVDRSIQMRVMGIDPSSVRWRIVALFLLTWPPLAVLTAVDGLAMGKGVSIGVPLLSDYAVLARFLIAVPLLVYADALIRKRAVDLCQYLRQSGIVTDADAPAFEQLAERFSWLRDSNLARVATGAAAVLSAAFLRLEFAGDVSTWQFVAGADGATRSAAGWWYLFVSIPTFHFLFGLGLWRYLVWCWFLFRISRLDLALVPTHPDRSAGLTIVGTVHQYHGMVVCALSSIVSAHIGLELVKGGWSMPAFRLQLGTFVVMVLIGLLVPLLAFMPRLMDARKRGLIEYGVLAGDYTRAFHRKWIGRTAPADETLLGSADVQSLADLANSFEVIHDMRIVPFELRTIVAILVWTALPLVPLVFIVFSPIDVIKGLVRIVL